MLKVTDKLTASQENLMQTSRLFLRTKVSRRDKLVIISTMLSYAADGVGKTELMYKAGLSSAQLERYLPILVRSELVEVSAGKRKPLYRTTHKGKSFLDTFDVLVKLLD